MYLKALFIRQISCSWATKYLWAIKPPFWAELLGNKCVSYFKKICYTIAVSNDRWVDIPRFQESQSNNFPQRKSFFFHSSTAKQKIVFFPLSFFQVWWGFWTFFSWELKKNIYWVTWWYIQMKKCIQKCLASNMGT